MPNQVDGAFVRARHVRYRAIPRANRIPAPSSRAYQQKPTGVEGPTLLCNQVPPGFLEYRFMPAGFSQLIYYRIVRLRQNFS